MHEEGQHSHQQLERELAEARERIRELEQRLGPDSGQALVNDVFEHHRDVVLYIDANNGDILWGNQAATSFYGYERGELTALHISDLNVMGREESRLPIQQVRERTRSRFLFTHRLKNGELKNIEVYSVPMTLEGREMICAFVRDLTGLSDVETSMEKSAAFQDTVLSSMEIVPFYCRNQDNFEPVYVGGSIDAVTGFSPERFYADPLFWPSRIHEKDRDKVVGRFKRLSDTGSTRCEYRWQVADGSWRWFALSMRLVPCDEINGTSEPCIAGLFWDITDRKRTEKSLLEREERYRTVADFTHDWEFWIGPDGSFLYVSPSFERVTGYRPEELKRDPALLFDTIVHPIDRDDVQTALMDGLLSDELLAFDFRIVTRAGDVRWIGHVSQAVYDDKGDPLGRRASNRDITGLKDTLQALKDKNQFINSMMDNSPATIYAKDVDGRYLFGNARFMQYAGKPAHEVLGKTDFGLFDNHLAERFQAGDAQVLETREPLFEELTMHHGGTVEHWTSTKFPLLNAEGEVLGICGMSLDVTAWREAEAGLRRMTLAVEQSPVSIAMTDTAGRILSVNPCFCETSGYEESEILERKLGFMLVDEDERFYDAVWETVRSGDAWQGEVCNKTKAGNVLWEHTSISPVRDGEETIVNFVVVKDDITERKRLERLKSDVERIVRHDLKSPIMSFIWVPRSLRKAENITEQQAILLGEMEDSAHRLLKMVNLSLDLFKMEEGTYHFVPEDLNILRIIQNVLHDLERTLTARKVTVNVLVSGRPATDGDCLVLRGEELLTHSMMSNLIANAVEASETGDTVTVDCSHDKEMRISVHNAALVPEDVRETFFDKYATSGKRFGTGLGTYSARLVAETQGGHIRMESASDSGTTVIVTFPSEGLCPSGKEL
ncbi:PAS domain S-box protein [Pseudodesulfovibrio sp.]|nr:PAS domain S-box protein [Pseudodesulfovibrio sp.]